MLLHEIKMLFAILVASRRSLASPQDLVKANTRRKTLLR